MKRLYKREKNIGASSCFWKGDSVGYSQKHRWLRNTFGKADKCENREKQVLDFICEGKLLFFHWAKKKEHEYTRNREDYYKLCKSCHFRYDRAKPIRYCECGKVVHSSLLCAYHYQVKYRKDNKYA